MNLQQPGGARMFPSPTSSPRIKRQHYDARVSPQASRAETPNEPARPQRKLNTHAAATFSGLARSTLEKLRVFGGGPNYIKIGRRVVYDLTDLEQWLAGHRRRSTSDICARPTP
jgi:predicted DNA-binding transcriptional regulator AlpA